MRHALAAVVRARVEAHPTARCHLLPGILESFGRPDDAILEDRYAVRAPELTTEEFLASVTGSPILSMEHQRLLQAFLKQACQEKLGSKSDLPFSYTWLPQYELLQFVLKSTMLLPKL